MAELQIIGAVASNFVWMCRIACAEKGVPYSLVPAMPHSPEVDAIHPLGKIPAMRHGDVTLCESRAICGYVDRAFPGPALMPADPVAAAQIEQWASIVCTAIDPVFLRQYFGAYVFPGTADNSPDRARIDAALPKMEPLFDMLDRAVPTGYLAGGAFTLADMCLMPILYYMAKAPESSAMLGKRGALKAYYDRHIARKSVREAAPPALPGHAARNIA
ncbi:MAG TPA: glutathione S-transferase family protein [Stellaceae bacterium]|nr:glutathione S-transferase family protein [Stellaceae bacterium]